MALINGRDLPPVALSARFEDQSSGVRYQLGLVFLGLSGLPRPGWLERAPDYEFILQAGEVAKRLRPRVPAPPVSHGGHGMPEEELRALVPGVEPVLRVEERTAMRLPEPVDFLCVDVWEERQGILDGSPSRQHVGQCFVPLEQRFNKRPCTWSIVKNSAEVGFITCRFALSTTPAAVRSLHVVSNATRADELRLVWEPPLSDGDLPLRGYRIEAREPQSGGRISIGGRPGYLEPRTASAPAAPEPAVTLKNLAGNTVYTIRVWAVNEAGAGPAAEIIGQTGPVAPGSCGEARIAVEGEQPTALSIEWEPPGETGGAELVAYRIWLRPVFQDGLGGFFPADGFIDLGLFEHRGRGTQRAPVKLDQLPSCSGCLCSVAAINAAGLTGCSSEAPVVWASSMDREKEIFELGSSASPCSRASRRSSQRSPGVGPHEPVALVGQEDAGQLEAKMKTPAAPYTYTVQGAPGPRASPVWWAAPAGPAASSTLRPVPAAEPTSSLPERKRPSWKVSARGSLSAGPPATCSTEYRIQVIPPA